ncbi:MAG: hypothetical protein JO021_19760 [Alphaproteobacteria bacterium]|nr:hypothetical protein [Alphaproteobacteria bacterium]
MDCFVAALLAMTAVCYRDRMTEADRKPFNPEREAELRALESLPDERIDTDDLPEVIDWRAVRGRFFRGSDGL